MNYLHKLLEEYLEGFFVEFLAKDLEEFLKVFLEEFLEDFLDNFLKEFLEECEKPSLRSASSLAAVLRSTVCNDSYLISEEESTFLCPFLFFIPSVLQKALTSEHSQANEISTTTKAGSCL